MKIDNTNLTFLQRSETEAGTLEFRPHMLKASGLPSDELVDRHLKTRDRWESRKDHAKALGLKDIGVNGFIS